MPTELPWWDDFLPWLFSAFPRPDWPLEDTWEAELREAVRRAGPADLLSLDAVQEATRRLNLRGMPYPDKFAAALHRELQDVFRVSSSGGPAVGSREEAERRSRDCECGGCGMTIVRVPAPERYQGHPAYARGAKVAAYCLRVCPMSRWLAAQHQANDPEVFRRLQSANRRSLPESTPDPELASL